MKVIILALGFMAIFEGLMPLIATEAWKKALRQMLGIDNESIRKVALTVICLGLAIIWSVNMTM